MTIDRESFVVPSAPPAIGPYVHAVASGGLLFCSGQIPLHPETGELVGTTPAEQARQCLENLAAVVEGAGGRLQDAVRCTVYLTDMGAFGEVNEVYGSFFPSDPPARLALGVAALPKGALVEVEAVVALDPAASAPGS
jgi:2-iminobutanoate/2-iminopropanoate deaminase